jgi:hypothetical protein
MNLAVQLPNGPLQDFGPVEARKAAAYLGGRLPHVDESEQAGVLRAIHDLDLAAAPENHFDVERFTPEWYVPGWLADP